MRTSRGQGASAPTLFSYWAAGLALGRHCGKALAAVERLAAGEKLAVYGGDAQGVALAAPRDHPLVERGPLGGVQFGGAEEVDDLARHVERDRQLRGGASSSPEVWSGRRSARRYGWRRG
ncbi:MULTISPECIES: hypothetical protein [unclassified Streptomyces]|uniref:hypothetical protein n=1 Tax=unclassified Streptomyces TaxID=2593676 RepID=UPI00136F4027|nr:MULTISPECIES: hypothetical protein [unclassified Streptomyces]MYQ40714.1 hypothetical protein [Streptomyces sp. SID4921]